MAIEFTPKRKIVIKDANISASGAFEAHLAHEALVKEVKDETDGWRYTCLETTPTADGKGVTFTLIEVTHS